MKGTVTVPPEEVGQGLSLSRRVGDELRQSPDKYDERGGMVVQFLAKPSGDDIAAIHRQSRQDTLSVEPTPVQGIEPEEERVISVDRVERRGCDDAVLGTRDPVHPAQEPLMRPGIVDLGPSPRRLEISQGRQSACGEEYHHAGCAPRDPTRLGRGRRESQEASRNQGA